MVEYRFAEIERRWQERWLKEKIFEAREDDTRPKYYLVEMLPYPSGRIHMGHVRNYSIGDAVARAQRMQGRNVLHPMGWDSFGLPAENAAIAHGVHPHKWTEENIAYMRQQMQSLGLSYAWSREFAAHRVEYYRWNQWLFLELHRRDLVYRSERLVNWCESCGTVLANEQVKEGTCWRCETPVTQRKRDQWFIRITRYAQELLDGIDRLEHWPDRVRTMQRNWIGGSEGAFIEFPLETGRGGIKVYTTRIDTIFGATALFVSPEHPEVEALVEENPEQDLVMAFVEKQRGLNPLERAAEGAVKEGIFTGRRARNPFTGEALPIWVANFVLVEYGTGAVMAVPGHDQRDYDFCKEYSLPVRPVIRPLDGSEPAEGVAFEEDGELFNSGPFSSLKSPEARTRMVKAAQEGGFGSATVQYRLKDWGISRQRYWGTPIPMIFCDKCGIVPVPVEDLPVRLPEKVKIEVIGSSPLARVPEFVNVKCPSCGGKARRETDTMDTFFDSSWYFYRYTDPRNESAPFDVSVTAHWTPIDLYIGGIEHATLHLIYARFFCKVLRDMGLLRVDEPADHLLTQGMVIRDGAKMSKSKGNVVDADAMVERYGADTTRLFALFAAPPQRDLEWNEHGVEGCYRFLNRLWRLVERARPLIAPEGGGVDCVSGLVMPETAGNEDARALELRRLTHRKIERVTGDLGERIHLNTAVAAIMELLNGVSDFVEGGVERPSEKASLREAVEVMVHLLAPFAPHISEEIWQGLGHPDLISCRSWPSTEPALLVMDEVTVIVQVNGKLRGRLSLPRGCEQDAALEAARADEGICRHLNGRSVRRVVYVPDKLLNLVVA
ncbi:MAG: leucine--tRNA ligase [Acidobacteriota bacterium]